MNSYKNEQRILKPGDKVVMNDNCLVPNDNKGKVWTVCSEPWYCCGAMLVKLEGYRGGYIVDSLTLIEGGD